MFCRRCGRPYTHKDADDLGIPHCVHLGTSSSSILLDEAMAIRARYELGRQFNPDHDSTSYRRTTEEECPVGDQLPIEGGISHDHQGDN